MDRMTKATLLIAGLVLGSYFAWAILGCVLGLDATCQLRCGPTGGMFVQHGRCVYHWTPKADQ
jgi:hypothetical protein